MTRRLEELASVFEDKVGAEKSGLLKIVTDLKAELDRPKYEELLHRAQDVGPGVKSERFSDRASHLASAQEKAHSEVGWDDLKKEAGPRKKVQMSRKKILKDISFNRDSYRGHRANLATLEAERDRLDTHIEAARNGVQTTRKDMLFLSDVLQTLDLSDSNYAVFYSNDRQDVSYILDKSKEEYHVKFEDNDLIVTPWKDHARTLRQMAREIEDEHGDDTSPVADSNEAIPPSIAPMDVSDTDFLPGIDRLEDPSASRSEEAPATSYPNYPNLRFVE